MKRLDLESLFADREAVKAMVAGLSDDDPVGLISLESRLTAIEQEIESLNQVSETIGSVALMFSGAPVFGSRSIQADFAATILKVYQDLVAKRMSTDEFGKLGSRGPLPNGASSTLSIREFVRGSVGFVLEESAANGEIADTAIKKAIDDVTAVIANAASESESDFEASVDSLDQRQIVSLREFFRTLDDSSATVRIVEGGRDATLDQLSVHRGRLRVDATDVHDSESDSVVGELLGLLPESRRFEMKLSDTGEVIRGSVAAGLATDWFELIEQPDQKLVGQTWRARMKIREVRERNRPPRYLYALVGLIELHDQ